MVDTPAEPVLDQDTVKPNQTPGERARESLPPLSCPRACGNLCPLLPSSDHLAVSLNDTFLSWGSGRLWKAKLVPTQMATVESMISPWALGAWLAAMLGGAGSYLQSRRPF